MEKVLAAWALFDCARLTLLCIAQVEGELPKQPDNEEEEELSMSEASTVSMVLRAVVHRPNEWPECRRTAMRTRRQAAMQVVTQSSKKSSDDSVPARHTRDDKHHVSAMPLSCVILNYILKPAQSYVAATRTRLLRRWAGRCRCRRRHPTPAPSDRQCHRHCHRNHHRRCSYLLQEAC